MPDDSPRVDAEVRNIRLHTALAVTVIALALQVHLPLYFDQLGNLDLPLLVAVYLTVLRRDVVAGLLIGAAVGLAQDSLTQGPIGVFGILKTVIGYLAATVSRFIEVDFIAARSVLTALFFLIHQLMFWIMEAVLLGNEISIDPVGTLIFATIHAGIAVLLFRFLDQFRTAP